MKVSELPDTEKPIFKMRYFGPERLSNTELIQLLTGVNDLRTAMEVIETSGGLPYLGKMSLEEFESISGIGESTAGKLMAAMELSKRVSLPHSIRRTHISGADDVLRIYGPEFAGQLQEIIISLMLNAKYEVIGRETITKGGITAAHFEPRDVYRPAVKRGATGIILMHNHPSGDPTPSDDDIYATRQLEQCGELIGVNLIDHIIIGQNRCVSMRDENLMEFGSIPKQKVAEDKSGTREKERERER